MRCQHSRCELQRERESEIARERGTRGVVPSVAIMADCSWPSSASLKPREEAAEAAARGNHNATIGGGKRKKAKKRKRKRKKAWLGGEREKKSAKTTKRNWWRERGASLQANGTKLESQLKSQRSERW